jgi:anti-anti-sigma factor
MAEEGRGPSRLSFVVDPSPHGIRVTLRGEADLATSSIFGDALAEAASLHPDLEVDLRELEFIDAGCVRVLLRVHGQVVSGGGTMRVLIGGGTVRRVFEVLDLDEQLSVRRAGTPPSGDDTQRSTWSP